MKKICKNCRFWGEYNCDGVGHCRNYNVFIEVFGECGDPNCGDFEYIFFGKNFGCIHWEGK